MAYIYKITNILNNKIYIGKTHISVEQRFKEHRAESNQSRSFDRPLYRAFRKYGVNNFIIDVIEQVDDMDADIRERYWIEEMNSYVSGYNATLGGDGKLLCDYDKIAMVYKELQNCIQTAQNCCVSIDTVYNALKSKGIVPKTGGETARDSTKKAIKMLDKKTGTLLQKFEAISDAGRFIRENKYTTMTDIDSIITHIIHVCKGNRRSAYGFKWVYDN